MIVKNTILTEEIGLVLEQRANLAPLAARIYANLILSSKRGLTFETIKEAHHASKSSVSNNLNVLIQLGYVEYYTKPYDRKRHFRTSKFYVRSIIEKYLEHTEKEVHILEKINAFNRKNNPEKYEAEKSIGSLYQDYLKESKHGFEDKLEAIDKLNIATASPLRELTDDA